MDSEHADKSIIPVTQGPITTKKKRRKSISAEFAERRKKEFIIALRQMGATTKEIADMAHCSQTTVIRVLRDKNIVKPEYSAEVFDKSSTSQMKAKMQIILNSLTPEEIKNAKFSERMVAFGILFDKMRLSENKSTANIHSLSAIVEGYHKDNGQNTANNQSV